MKKLRVDPGACGMTTEVVVELGPGRVFTLTVETDCPMVRDLAAEVGSSKLGDALAPFDRNAVYRAAAASIRHVACPVPSAILKAMEAEAGASLPRPVRMDFVPGAA